MGKKIRIIVSLLVVAIIGILIIPPQDNSNEVIIQSDVITSDDINLDQDIIDEAFQAYSIVDTERVFTESDQSIIEQFLDENDLPSSSEKFGIEVQTVLFDSDQKEYPSSSVIGIPSLVVTDDQGRVLDLGSIQTSFLGINSDSERGDEKSFNLDGTVKFYLDDDLISTKKLYSSETGSNDNYKLSILDSIPPPSFDRPQAFTFTLSDEGSDWLDQSEHTYRVVVTEINAEINSDDNIKKFSWNGEKIAYELKVKVDEKKKVVYDYTGKAISIFKDDSTIQVCGVGKYQKFPYLGIRTIESTNPSVTVKDTSGNILAQTDGIVSHSYPVPTCNAKHCYPTISSSACTEKISGIPRDKLIVIDVLLGAEKMSYTLKTPLSQKNYYLNQGLESDNEYKCKQYTNSNKDQKLYGGCDRPVINTISQGQNFISNFGYDSKLNQWSGGVQPLSYDGSIYLDETENTICYIDCE